MSAEVEQILVVHKVKAASIYKLLFCGLLLTLVPLGLLFGISGFFGADTVKWNNQPVHGWGALFAGPALSGLLALFFAGFLGTLASLGLWLFSRFRTISIRVVLAQPVAPKS
ncbi:MAG: hypothetical protein ACT4NV_11150 [Rhodoferax sp.]